MSFEALKEIQFDASTPIRLVMEAMNRTAILTQGKGFALVVNESGVCLGVVSDGDLRNKLAAGTSLDAPISEVMNADFTFAHADASKHGLLREFDQGVAHIPILDELGKPKDLIQFSDFNANSRATTRITRSRAPARISFSGGGTDMTYYFRDRVGYVLSTAINKYSFCGVEQRDDDQVLLVSGDYGREELWDRGNQIERTDELGLIKACVKVMDPNFGFRLETRSEVDPGTGLGGSSALSAAVVGALNQFRNPNHLDRYHLVDLSYQAERVELEVAGGWQDQCAAIFGGLNLIEFRRDEILVVPLRIAKDAILELQHNLLLCRFGGSRDSGAIITDAKVSFNARPAEKIALYEEMTRVTLEMKDALLRGRLRRFGELLDSGWQLKKKFSKKISNDRVEALYEAAKGAGALGAKVLGAGASGYLLVYAENGVRSQVIEALAEEGGCLERFDFVSHGIETWTVER